MQTVKIINKSGLPDPVYESVGSVGMDVRATCGMMLAPGERCLIKTGLFLEIPFGYECQVRSRSGLALKRGLAVLNSPGTIDSDYRGEVGVILINHSREYQEIDRGDRIAQLVFARVAIVKFEHTNDLTTTERGEGGFGSTGV